MSRILLSGFEPFGGDAGNPSADAVRALASAWSGPDELITAVLPVTFAGASAQVRDLIAEHSPDLVLATGLAGGRPAISMERVAINLRDARIPDNAGAQPADEPCLPGGPTALFSTLPVKAMARAVAEAGIPAVVSYTAGTFVCNDVFYAAVDASLPGSRAGFVHLPWSIDTAPKGAPALPLAQLVEGLRLALVTALGTAVDDRTPIGPVH